MDVESGTENRWRSMPQAAPEMAIRSDTAVPPNIPMQSDAAMQSELLPDGDEAVPGRTLPNLILANSWIVSLVFHLTILIVLSLLTYTLHSGANLELELANSPADDATFMIESEEDSNDGNNLDDQMEQMLASSEESTKFEINTESFEFDPQVSLENMNGSDQQTSDATEGLISSERKVGNGNQAQFFGLQATGKNFVFIVDSSGSMSGSRWKNAVQELRRSLAELQENQKFYVIFFDHQTHLMFQGRVDKFRKSRQLKMLNATKKNLARVNNWFRRVDLGSHTRPRISFDYGLALEPDAIFFLTDGEFNDGTYEHLMTIASQSQSKRPTIHTVAFGNPFSSRALEEIASRFNGKYRFVR